MEVNKMLPAKKQSVQVGTKTWGRLPTNEIQEFDSPFLYNQTYEKEYDLYVEDMYQLDNERRIELPEDYPMYA